METELSKRMRELSRSRDDLPENWLELAEAFDHACAGFYAEPQTVSVKQFLGAYARARKAWCAVTGEPFA